MNINSEEDDDDIFAQVGQFKSDEFQIWLLLATNWTNINTSKSQACFWLKSAFMNKGFFKKQWEQPLSLSSSFSISNTCRSLALISLV